MSTAIVRGALLATVVLVALTAPAAAQVPELARREAEVCVAHKQEPLEKCAGLYLNMYNASPQAPDGDEVLYNAGYLYAQAHAVTAAVTTFGLLRKNYPKSKIAMKALAYSARLYADIAMYDRAAELLEEYAKKYAGEKDAYEAMSDAVYYRKALGDDDKAIEDTKYFVKMFGAKMPREAADAHFALTAIYEKKGDRDAVRKHLLEHVQRFGRRGVYPDRAVIAYAKIGETLWADSCPVPAVDGKCVRIKPAKQQPVCSGGATTTVEVVKRKDKQATSARDYLKDAKELFERVGGRIEGDEAAARYYYARAVLAIIDAEAEDQVWATPPAPVADYDAWLQDQIRARAKALSKYEAVLAIKDPATSIVAAARIAQGTEAFSTAILGAAKTTKDCTKVEQTAAALREKAKLSYGVCLAKATELSWFDDEGGRVCERALVRLVPEDFPPLRERVGDATNAALVITGESLTADLATEAQP